MEAAFIGAALLVFALAQLLRQKIVDPISFERIARDAHPSRFWGGLGTWVLLAGYAFVAPAALEAAAHGITLLATLVVPVPAVLGLYLDRKQRSKYS
jgi:hypothetical protein